MKRIDIFGVPGSGKTTIYKELRKKKKAGNWYTSDEVVRKIYKKHFRKKKYSIPDYFYLFASLLHPAKSLIPLDREKYRQFITKEVVTKEPVIEYYLENISRDQITPPYLKARRMEFLLSALEDVILLEAFCDDEVVLCDESLTARLFLFVFDTFGKNISQFSADLDTFAPPDGYIFLDADPGVIMERIGSRGRVTVHHSRLTEKEIEADIRENRKKYQMARELLSKKGIKGIVVDTSEPLKQCLDKVEQYLYGL
jgi:thymidylate kinase